MRVLHITPYYEQAWAYGGIPRVATALAQGLRNRGHQVTVCTTDACSRDRRLTADDASAIVTGPGNGHSAVHVLVFPNLWNRVAYDWQLFLPVGLARFLRRRVRDFDVAHLHACHNLPGVLAARYLTQAGVPYVLTPHGTAPRIERRTRAKRFFDLSVGRKVLPGAAQILAVTEAERSQLLALGLPSDVIAVVPNAIDLAEFRSPIRKGAFRQRAGLGGATLVMFLGKLTPRKRVDVLLRAFARLNRRDAQLVIVGNDMGYVRELNTLIHALGLSARTTQVGLVTGHERLEALADADVVCYPSQDEVFGLVPVEAILSGTPAVVADDSGCGEVIRRVGGGLAVARGDHEAFGQALDEILSAPEIWRARVGQAAERIRACYGADTVCAQLESVYAEAIAAAPWLSRAESARPIPSD